MASLQERLEALIGVIKPAFDALTGRVTTIEDKAYASFYTAATGITSINNTVQTLELTDTLLNSDTGVFSLGSNQVTVQRDGDYWINFDCSLRQSGSSRSEYTIWLEVNGVQIDGARSNNYERGYGSGQSSSIGLIVSLTAGQNVRARCNRTDGGSTTGSQLADGTRLVIREM